MNTLIIGSGAREHALLKSCKNSPLVSEVAATPGNGGMAQDAYCYDIPVEDTDKITQLAIAEDIQFVIVGPEVPLALGIVDALRKENILVYGPTQDAAQLETSKAFSKSFLKRYDIPTAEGETFRDASSALKYLNDAEFPVVIKASGLAAGKGVIIAESTEEAEEAVKAMLEGKTFGSSGDEIVIEEFLTGDEASITAVVAGNDYVLLPASQDHKRIGENDTGPNTGGMGAYAPADIVTPKLNQTIIDTIIEPTLQGLSAEGIQFTGTLYVGLMVTPTGPKVLEFNVRFGDPETQVLLPLFETDPVELLLACAQHNLSAVTPKFKDEYAIAVVQAAHGYPGTYNKGDSVSFPSSVPENVQIVHAGTKQEADGKIVTNGGRVLSVVATEKTLEKASEDAYSVCYQTNFANNYFRTDIGARQLQQKVTL